MNEQNEDWRKETACVLNNLKECLAKAPEACACKKMPKQIYQWYLNDLVAKGIRREE
jgi:hypothetical protein